MTEAKWQSGTDPVELLSFCAGKVGRGTWPSFEALVGRFGQRKVGLFAAACCRRLWARLDRPARELIELFERYCEGEISVHDMFEAHLATHSASPGVPWLIRAAGKLYCIGEDTDGEYWDDLVSALKGVQRESGQPMFKERIHQAHLVREVFGNPFRPVALDPVWLARDAGAAGVLARAIYEECRFGDLPILADALEEAGCAEQAILSHCRSGGEHARGCWALGVVLGR